MTYNFRIKKNNYTVEVPEIKVETLTQEQLNSIVQKWHKNTAAYLARLEVMRESTVIKTNAEKLQSLIEYGMQLGKSKEEAEEIAIRLMTQKDPNFRLTETSSFQFSLEDLFSALPETEEE